jgi:hypothetical protein
VRNFHRLIPACKRIAETGDIRRQKALRRGRNIVDLAVSLLQLL